MFSRSVNFNDLPDWQKRGVGLYWEKIEKVGYNPKENTEIKVERNEIKIDYDLPMREEYSNFIMGLITQNKS